MYQLEARFLHVETVSMKAKPVMCLQRERLKSQRDILWLNAWSCSVVAIQSHARTVVRECCKGDDESQWERVKFDPPATQKTLNRRSPKFAYLTTLGISTIMQNFIQIGLGVSVLRMRDFAPLGTKWLSYFWVQERQRATHAHTS